MIGWGLFVACLCLGGSTDHTITIAHTHTHTPPPVYPALSPESVIRMPGAYQANNHRHRLGRFPLPPPARAAGGQRPFVFLNANQPYKHSAEV